MTYRVKTHLLKEFKHGCTIKKTSNGVQYAHEGAIPGDPAIPEDVINRNPEWFEKIDESIEVGEYWICTKDDGTVVRVEKLMDKVTFSGIDRDDEELTHSYNKFREDFRKLSDKEVEQALIKEAKRREYAKGNFRCLSHHTYAGGEGYSFSDKGDLFFGVNMVYHRNGDRWAEIIEDEWEVEEYQDSCYIVVKGDRTVEGVRIKELSENEAEAIANALNNLNNGTS